MIPQPSRRNIPQRYYTPTREILSLKVSDIPGAQPRQNIAMKNVIHYRDKLSYDKDKLYERMFNQEVFNSDRIIFGGGHSKEEQGSKVQKRHFGVHYDSEIEQTNAMNGGNRTEIASTMFDYPRNLSTMDIPGAATGTLKSKSMRNRDTAEKKRQSSSVMRSRVELPRLEKREVGDSLDRFNHDYTMVKPEESKTDAAPYQEKPSSSQEQADRADNLQRGLNNQRFDLNLRNSITNDPELNREESQNRAATERAQNEASQRYAQDNRKSNYDIDDNAVRNEDNYTNRSYAAKRCESQPNLASTINKIQENPSIENLKRNEPAQLPYYLRPNRNREPKKIYTYNVISNQPVPRTLPGNVRLPYRYAVPFEYDQLSQSIKQEETNPNKNSTLNLYDKIKSNNFSPDQMKGYQVNQNFPQLTSIQPRKY